MPTAKWIIDSGGYIGDAGTYFLNRFPESHLLSLEPNQESYTLAQRNLLPYGERVHLFQVGLWDRDVTLAVGGAETGSLFEKRMALVTRL